MTTSSGLNPVAQKIYIKTALEFLKANLLFWDIFQIKKTIAKNSGRSVVFRRFNKLTPVTTGLTEGVTPAGSNVTSDDYEFDLTQYGDFTIITDVVSETDYDPKVKEEIKGVMNYQMKQSLDMIVMEVLSQTAQILYPNGKTGANLAGTDVMDTTVYGRAITMLRETDVPGFDGDLYMVTMTAKQENDLKNDANNKVSYVELSKYTSQKPVTRAAIGVYNQGVIKTTSMTKSATVNSIPVREAMFFGADGYGVAELAGHNMEIIVKSAGSSGTADPLNQRGSIGWKLWFGASSLDDLASGGKNSRAIKVPTAVSF